MWSIKFYDFGTCLCIWFDSFFTHSNFKDENILNVYHRYTFIIGNQCNLRTSYWFCCCINKCKEEKCMYEFFVYICEQIFKKIFVWVVNRIWKLSFNRSNRTYLWICDRTLVSVAYDVDMIVSSDISLFSFLFFLC